MQDSGEVGCAQAVKQLVPTVEDGLAEGVTDGSLVSLDSPRTGECGFSLWTNGFLNTAPELDRRLLGTLPERDLLPKGGGEEEAKSSVPGSEEEAGGHVCCSHRALRTRREASGVRKNVYPIQGI